jgi:hypothetical protein
VKNDGKQAERSFVDYWTARGAHVERLRDRRDLIALNGGKPVADFKKPSDFLVSAPGVPLHYAEVKSTCHATRFEFKQIEEGQARAAQLEYLRGNCAYTFYIFSYQLGRWFTMSCELYCHQLKMGRASIAFEDLTPWTK